MITQRLFLPVGVSKKVAVGTIFKSVQRCLVILQRQSVVVECFVLHHGVGVAIHKIRLVDRKPDTMRIINVDIHFLVYTALGSDDNHTVGTACAPQGRSSTILQHRHALHIIQVQVLDVTGNAVYHNQRVATSERTSAAHHQFGCISPSGVLLHNESRNQSVESILNTFGRIFLQHLS